MNILYTQKIKTYQGKYLAVTDNKVIAIGKNAKEAYEVAKKIIGKKKAIDGVYYIPQKRDFVTALCVSHISS